MTILVVSILDHDVQVEIGIRAPRRNCYGNGVETNFEKNSVTHLSMDFFEFT